MNWLGGEITEPGVFQGELGAGISIRTPVNTDSVPGTTGYLLVRPEHVRISASPVGSDTELQGTVASQIYLGPATHYYVRVGDHTFIAYEQGGPSSEIDAVFLSWPQHKAGFMPVARVTQSDD